MERSIKKRPDKKKRKPSRAVPTGTPPPQPAPQQSLVSPFAIAPTTSEPEPQQPTGRSSLDTASLKAKAKQRSSSTAPPAARPSIFLPISKIKKRMSLLSPFSVTSRRSHAEMDRNSQQGTSALLPGERVRKGAFEEWYEAAHKGTVSRTADSSNRLLHTERSNKSIGPKRGFALATGICLSVVLFALLVGMAYLYPVKDEPVNNTTSARACGTARLHQLDVLTANGLVTGRSADVVDPANNSSVQGVLRHFFGIPYGEPPTGPLRFGMPKAISNFAGNGTWDAGAHGPRCPQWGPQLESSNEDCLRLSIWAPYVCNDSDPLKTVVVAVAGDWMQTGDLRDHEDFWQRLALQGDLIVTVINHRQGVLGFLAGVGDDSAPGNVALYDVHLAVVWMHNNAAAFHGDGNAMVALGRGSGGFMFSSLLFTNSDRYLKRLILHGLSVTSLLPRNEETGVSLLSTAVHCPKGVRAAEITACLRHKDVRSIVTAAHMLLPLRFVPSRYRAPMSHGIFSQEGPKPPRDLKGVDVLCGTSMSEGEALFDQYVVPGMNISDGMNVPDVFHRCVAFFADKVRLEYKDMPDAVKTFLTQPRLRGFRKILRDLVMTCPMSTVAKAAADSGAAVYHYVSTGAMHFFEPVLSLEDIVLFATAGKVAEKWTPFSEGASTLVVNGSSRTVVQQWMTERCKVYSTFNVETDVHRL
ncbi:hypothetical protein HPB50_024549 [Hyalomma asiaticum]|uniref:Uncharacterized protein n=1 Tax=Hyalomma asiaticum TaxID=266040 RepID=A0ACB7SMW3_HYAAI|nr:hypothetical protein HPB50_024549 [Hyalomma asiaticum]